MITDIPEIYVLRHGETTWNREGRMQGDLDSPLTPKGQEQAKTVAGLLAARGVTAQTHVLLSSPQGRAMATAQAVANAMGAHIQTHADLREISVGEWTGLTREEITTRWPAEQKEEHFLDFYARAPNGETFDALWQRVCGLLASLTGPTVLVTHGITSRFLRTAATGRSLADVRELPGGQGVVFRVADRYHEIYASEGLHDQKGHAKPPPHG
ncbi:MAG: histidine phosphatase family protein [Pseudomonadota bacterium]